MAWTTSVVFLALLGVWPGLRGMRLVVGALRDADDPSASVRLVRGIRGVVVAVGVEALAGGILFGQTWLLVFGSVFLAEELYETGVLALILRVGRVQSERHDSRRAPRSGPQGRGERGARRWLPPPAGAGDRDRAVESATGGREAFTTREGNRTGAGPPPRRVGFGKGKGREREAVAEAVTRQPRRAPAGRPFRRLVRGIGEAGAVERLSPHQWPAVGRGQEGSPDHGPARRAAAAKKAVRTRASQAMG
jgi:hypothetical protein